MKAKDPVLARLAELPHEAPSPEISASIRRAATVRLRPRPVHPAWPLLIAASTVVYLGWAVHFSSGLY